MDTPKYLTPSEVVERLHNVVSAKTLANWRSNKEGPPFSKFGGRILYPVDALTVWERERQYTSTRDYGKKETVQ